MTQLALVVRLPGRDRTLKVGKICLYRVDRGEFVFDQNVDDTVWNLKRNRADFFRRVDAQSPALDHCRSAHAEGRAFGRDDYVATGNHRCVACETTAIDHGDHRHQAAQS